MINFQNDCNSEANTLELKSFLDMVNFCGKFVKKISTQGKLRYEFLKKDKHWQRKMSHTKAFNTTKKLLCSAEVLTHFQMSLQSIVKNFGLHAGIPSMAASRLQRRAKNCQLNTSIWSTFARIKI